MKKRNWKKVLLTVLLAVVGLALLAGVAGGTYLFDYAIVRKPPLSNTIVAGGNALSNTMAQSRIDGKAWLEERQAQQLRYTAEDGVALVGYYVPAETASTKTAVLVHGHRSDATMMGNFGKLFYAEGYNVFMADNRGHGESGGDYVGMGWLDRKDYLGWLTVLQGITGEDTAFVLHGVSMGASTILMMSGEEALPDTVKAIVADCGFSSVEEEFRYQIGEMLHLPAFPILQIGSLETRLLAGYSFGEADALAQVKKATTPIMIIHGDADSYNPTAMGQALFEAIPGEKELWLVPGAEHGMAYYTAPEAYQSRMMAFVGTYVD